MSKPSQGYRTIRAAAVLCLAAQAGGRAGEAGPWVRRLAAGRTAEREAAFVVLEGLPAPSLAAEARPLVELVEAGDWPAQCYAARLLALAGPAAQPVAARIDAAAGKALTDGRQTCALMLAGALAGIGRGSAHALPGALEKALRSGDAGSALPALKVSVALAGDGQALLPAVFPLLESPDAEVRTLAARVVRQHGAAAGPAVPLLGANLRHAESSVAREAARALVAAGPLAAPVVPALREALKRAESSIVEDALAALAAVGPAAAPAYEDVAALLVGDEVSPGADPRPSRISMRAERTLAAMGPGVVPSLVEMVKADRDRGPVAARILGAMGPAARSTGPLLLKSLEKAGKDPRSAKMICNLAAALIRIDPAAAEKTVPAFAAVLAGEDLQAATQAADFLFKLGLGTTDKFVREAVVATLAKGLQSGGRRGRSNDDFAKLWTQTCLRLPEFGKAGDAAVPVLKDCVFSGAPFAGAAKRAWQMLRPNEQVSSAPSVESAGADGAEKGGDAIDDL